MSDYNERPVWRQVLSICLVLFALVRLGISCSKMNNTNRNQNLSTQPAIDLNSFENSTRTEAPTNYEYSSTKVYNEVFYKPYKYLDSLSTIQRGRGYIVKMEKDSLINIDYSSKFRVLKNSYFQNTHDDSLRFATKSPNLIIFVHGFESNDSLDSSFKKLKQSAKLKNYRPFIKLSENSKLVCYSITKENTIFRAMAYLVQQKNYRLFIEFESNKLSQIALEEKTMRYVSQNIIAKK